MGIKMRISRKYLRPWISISAAFCTLLVFQEHLSPVLYGGYSFWLCITGFLFIFVTVFGNVRYIEESNFKRIKERLENEVAEYVGLYGYSTKDLERLRKIKDPFRWMGFYKRLTSTAACDLPDELMKFK